MPPSRRASAPPPAAPSRALWLVPAVVVIVPALVLGGVMLALPRDRPRVSSRVDDPGPSAVHARARLRGRVTTDDGEPALGARVTVVGPPPTYATVREGEVDGAGRFAFVDTGAASRVRVVAERDGGLVASEELVVGSDTPDVVLALTPARNVRGKATFDDGAVAVGAVIEIVDAPPWARRRATTDDTGAYSLPIVPRSARSLRASAKGAAVVTLTLAGTEPEELADITLHRESEIDGAVVDADDKPVRRAEVVACDGRDEGSRAWTDAGGRFQLPRRFVDCSLVASHDSHAPSDPTPARGERPTLRLKAGGTLAGTVVDDGGRPAAECYVGVESFAPAGGAPSVRSGLVKTFKDPSGAFALDKLAPGTYVLTYGAPGHVAQRSPPIELRAGETRRDVRLALFAGGTIEGLVTDDDGKPLADVSVAFDVVSSARRPEPAVRTGADGRYKLDGAPPDRFSVRFDKPGHRSRVLTGLVVAARASLVRDVSLPLADDGGPSSEVGGIGAVLNQTRVGVVFVAVHPGTPADRAGLQKGDVLTAVDGRSTRGQSVAELTQALRGDAGTKVRVAVTRDGAGDLEVTVERAAILR